MPELTTDFQSLPEEYQHVIKLAQETYKITVAPLQLLVGGWSGAVVYLVSVSSNETQRVEHCILKLDRKGKAAKSDEVTRHNIVLSKSTPAFARNHIAELVFDCVEHEGAIAIFYRIAGQSLLKYRPLSKYERQNQLKTIFTQTNTVLLTEWNANPTFEQAIHPQKLLEKWLGRRLNAGGTIERFLQDICQVNPDIGGLLISGHVFPNPLLYARKPEPWGKPRSIDIATGLIHGDLNTNNILVMFSENKEKLQGYYLIDFALFEENMPLLFDQRYLEMSYLLHAMSEVSFAKCVNLLTQMSEVDILDSYKAPIELSGVSAVTGSARSAFSKWIQANHPSLLDDLWGQYWLAGVAAGLNFCHKRGMSAEQRLAGLIYAAANLKRYAATFKLPLPTNVELLYDDTQTAANKSVSGSSRNTHKQNLPSGTVTFLFTDIEGSTKLSQQYPDAMPGMLARHHEILNECIKTHGGYAFQIVGDSFAVAFHSAIDALNAALDAQRLLHNEAWSPAPIKVRMGIHTGTAHLNDASAATVYSGYATIALTQRIMSAGHGGQILLSGTTRELVRDALPADSELQDMGEKRLKDSLHPEHLFQLNIAGLSSDFPPLNTLTHRHNLPVQVTSFIAREREIALVHEYLSRDDIRLVTLIGPPGIGKTRLSIEAARASLQEFPDGVFFVALAPLDNPKSIASAIIQALGYIESGDTTPEDQLKESIGHKQMLIVLDNCEHLIEEIASIASRLLSACPRLKMLATSRESFRIPGEWLYPIPAFDIPKERDTIDLDNASDFPALMLFVERARAVRPDFKLTANNIQTITAICAHLDGLPLVIELIAARIRLMSPQALLERLSGHFVLTADGMRAPSERQKTLWNAIDWSYNLLSAEEQKLFVYLSVFSGGFTLADAEAIFAHTVTEKSVPELLALLLDKSLIRRVASESSEDRYQMLVTIQEYARERLGQLAEETEIRNWHLTYFSELARRARPHLRSADQLEWLDRLDTEYDNIRAALSWAQASGSIVTGLQLGTDLEVFWIYRAYLREPCFALENLLAASASTDPLHILSRGHVVAGFLQMFLGNLDVAQAHAKESERLCLQLGQAYIADLADARNLIVPTDVDFRSDPVRSRQAFEQNLKLFQEAGDQWQIAHTTFNIGERLGQIGDFTGARQAFEQSLVLFQDCGDHFRVVNQQGQLAGIAFEEGKYAEARLRLEEVVSFRRQARFNIHMEIDLYRLGMIAIREGDYTRAKAWFTECLLFIQQTGVNNQIAECLIGLAGIAVTEKRFERAVQIAGAVEMQVEARQDPQGGADRAELKRLTTILREELDDAEFEALAAKGRAMTMEQAIAFALE